MPDTAKEIVDALLEGNRYNPMGLHRNHRGQLLDKYGRVMDIDWDKFEKKRPRPGKPLKYPQVLNPLHAAAKVAENHYSSHDIVNDLLDQQGGDPKILVLCQAFAEKGYEVTAEDFKGVDPRDLMVMYERLIVGDSIAAIARKYKVQPEKIRQFYHRGVRRLRWNLEVAEIGLRR